MKKSGEMGLKKQTARGKERYRGEERKTGR
jgi:hypothetical protein